MNALASALPWVSSLKWLYALISLVIASYQRECGICIMPNMHIILGRKWEMQKYFWAVPQIDWLFLLPRKDLSSLAAAVGGQGTFPYFLELRVWSRTLEQYAEYPLYLLFYSKNKMSESVFVWQNIDDWIIYIKAKFGRICSLNYTCWVTLLFRQTFLA